MPPGSLITKMQTQKESNKNNKPTKKHEKLIEMILLMKKKSTLPQ